MSEEFFSKVLIAKYSPKNGCCVADGEILTIKPRQSIPQRDHLRHFFVSARDLKTKSRYGWVEVVERFTLAAFIRNYSPNRELSGNELDHIRTMLSSINKLTQGTPVAATYSSRGVHRKTMQLTVHKVVFYPKK